MPQLDERPEREGERRGEQEQDLADRRLDDREHVAKERDRPDGAPAAAALRHAPGVLDGVRVALRDEERTRAVVLDTHDPMRHELARSIGPGEGDHVADDEVVGRGRREDDDRSHGERRPHAPREDRVRLEREEARSDGDEHEPAGSEDRDGAEEPEAEQAEALSGGATRPQPPEARTFPERARRVGMPRAPGEPHERVPERAGHCVRCQEKLVVARRPWRLLSLSSGSRTPIVRMSRAPAGSDPTITAVWAEAWADAKAPMVLLRSEKSQRFPSGLPPYTQAAGIERDGSVHSWM